MTVYLILIRLCFYLCFFLDVEFFVSFVFGLFVWFPFKKN